MENIEKGFTGRNIYILSDGQAAIKTLESFQINSKLVWDCHQSLVKLADHNWIQLVWAHGNWWKWNSWWTSHQGPLKLPDEFQISLGLLSILGEADISAWTRGNWWKWNSWWISLTKLLTSLTGREPAIGIATKVARMVIRDLIRRKHEEHWKSIRGQRQAKDFL